jgi:hypothetical protein
MHFRLLCAALAALASPAWSGVDNDLIPDDAGQVKVTCTGVDDTDAIVAAMRSANRMVQLPYDRTCLVRWPEDAVHGIVEWRSDSPSIATPPVWRAELGLIGARHAATQATRIRLMDNQPQFQDANNPKAIIYSASPGLGDATAFRNFLESFVVECGNGNPGCVPVDHHGSNVSHIRNMRIETQSGVTGLRLDRAQVGPMLAKNIQITGGDYCIRSGSLSYGWVGETIFCADPKKAGLHNGHQSIALRDFRFTRSPHVGAHVPAVDNASNRGHIVLIDSTLTSTAGTTGPAIQGAGTLYTRNVATSGWGTPLVTNSIYGNFAGPLIADYSTNPPVTAFTPDVSKSLGLPVSNTPGAYFSRIAAEWVNVNAHGATHTNNADDDTAGWQAALNVCLSDPAKGKIIYGPAGNYDITAPLNVPGCVQTIDLMGGQLRRKPGHSPILFRVIDSGPAPLTFKRASIAMNDTIPILEFNSPRKLVIMDSTFSSTVPPLIGSLAGDIYVENAGMLLDLPAGKRAWARQINPDRSPAALGFLMRNSGKLWMLGVKSEQFLTPSVTTLGTGCTEIFGGLSHTSSTAPAGTPFAVVENGGRFSMTMAASWIDPGDGYAIGVRETRGATTVDVPIGSYPGRGNGRRFNVASAAVNACQ